MNIKQNKIELAKKHAEIKRGFLLSTEYLGAHGKLEWKCSNENHPSWFATYANCVNCGGWCPLCRRINVGHKNKNKNALPIAKEFAISKGGICLSTEYLNCMVKLNWQCSCGHIWMASYSNVINHGRWCPECRKKSIGNKNRKKDGLDLAKKYALSKGGQCLSTQYINNTTKMFWQCSSGHTWEAIFNNVNGKGSWCPQCAGQFSKEEGLLRAIKCAESKEGKCLSTEYINNSTKLKWQCSSGHIWMASYGNVTKGTWCPECSVFYYKEHRIRDLLEYLLETKFEKLRPCWNRNPDSGNLLELDGYSQELNIAFEFQGIHHYQTGMFNQNQEDLEYTKYKDEIKKTKLY